jgi:hypothetical protein
MWMLLVGLYSSLLVAQDGKTSYRAVDYDVINKLMKTITNLTIENDAYVQSADPIFDKKYCNLGEAKMRYTVPGKMKDTPWKKGTETTVDASLTMEGQPNAPVGIKIHSAPRVTTDVVALVRYTASIALNAADPAPQFKERIKKQLELASRLANLTEVYDLVVANHALSLEIVDYEAANAQKKLMESKQANDANAVTYYERQLAGYGLMKRSYEVLKFTAERDPASKAVTAIIVEHNEPAGFLSVAQSDFVAQKIKSTLKTDSIFLELFANYRLSKNHYEQLRSDLQGILVGMETNDPGKVDDVKDSFKRALIEFKMTILGQRW